jgi:ribosomal protein L9
MAILATENNIKIAKIEIEKKEILEAKKRKNLNTLSERLNKLTIKFTLKSGEDDKLFGSEHHK